MRRLPYRTVLSALVLTLALWTPAQGAAQRVEEKIFPSQNGDTIVVQNDFGLVRIRGGATTEIKATIRRIAQTEAQLENVTVQSSRSGSKVFFTAYYFDYAAESVYLDIVVPDWANASVWGANSAIEISDLKGFVRVYTQTGLITASNLSSSVTLNTDSGDVQFTSRVQPNRDVRLESVFGNIRCNLAEDMNVRGWVRAGERIGWNGEIELSQGQLEKQVGIGGPLLLAASMHGNVSVLFDKGPAISVAPLDLSAGAPTQVVTSEPAPAPSRPATMQDTGVAPPSPRQTSRTNGPPVLRDPAPPAAGGTYNPADSRPTANTPPIEYDTSGTADAGAFTLKVDVNWIYLNASVRDRHSNRSVGDLHKEDFLVWEDSRPQRVEQFANTAVPYNLLLLLDVSGSTKQHMDMIQEASIQFTRQINEEDKIAIATFNSRSRLVQDFTNDRIKVARAISRIRSGGGTAFYDALDESINDYMAGIEGRKAIVVFTDGVDNQLTGDWSSGSRTEFHELFRGIQEIDTIIYTIFLDTENRRGRYPGPTNRQPRGNPGGIPGGIPGGTNRKSVIDILGDIMGGRLPPSMDDSAAYETAREQLGMIADQTGGRMYEPYRVFDLDQIYQEIADDLRVQYLLAYNSDNPINDGGWREIQVQVRNRDDLAVRARRGYYAPGADPNARRRSPRMP